MFAFGIIYVCSSALELPRKGPLFESDSNKRRGEAGPLFESPPWPLLKSGMRPLGRYGTGQETISRRPEHVFSICHKVGNGFRRGHYSGRSRINARGSKLRIVFKSFSGQLLKSCMGPLARYSNYQDINRTLEQVYLPSDPRAIIPVGFEEMQGPKCGHHLTHPWTIIYVRPGALGWVRHQCKSLSYVAEYLYQIC